MKNLRDYTVTPASTMQEVIKVIDQGAAQIALVVDADGRLVGTITDGDVRRAILRSFSLDTPAKEIMHREFRKLGADADEAEALAMMRRHTLHQVPAVDEGGHVTRLFLLEDLIKPKVHPNAVVLMAGGEGKRLRPLTEDCPKPMLRVGGKPLLEIILQQCIDAGFQRFYLSVNYLKHQVKEYFGDGAGWGVSIEYLEETKPLGTAGALSLLPFKPNHPVLVMNGDVLTRVDFKNLMRFHDEHQSAATLCVREHTTQIPYGVIGFNDVQVLSFKEKPVVTHHVNAGIYLLDPKLLGLMEEGRYCDMPQLLEKAMKSEYQVSAFPIHEYWLDVGHPETLQQADGDWR